MIDILTKANNDLDQKLSLERRLKRKLTRYHNSVVNQMVAEFQSNGNQINMALFDEELQGILNDHYAEVSSRFRGTVADELPDDVEITDQEKAAIAAALAAFFFRRAAEMSEKINRTTQSDIGIAFQQAQEDELAREETGQGLKITIAVLAGAIMRARLKNRVDSIAVTETQMASETTKATEAEILTGIDPAILAATPVKTSATKEWVTVGDSRVRDEHRAADGQIQRVGDPYNVGFELLMRPGDTSLGASLGNVINCRCSSIDNVSSIIAIRRGEE